MTEICLTINYVYKLLRQEVDVNRDLEKILGTFPSREALSTSTRLL